MGRRKGQSWFNYIGNSIPIVKLFVKGENYQDYGNPLSPTQIGNNLSVNLNSANSPKMNKQGSINPYLPALLNAGGAVIGSAVNANAQKDINEQNIAWAMQNYKMSREDAIAFWQMENDYNSPSAQMGRLKDAGLNPHLVYGSGATATGGSISSPQYQTPNLKAPQYGDAISNLSTILATQQMQSQIQKTNAETNNIKAQTEGREIDIAVKKMVGTDKMARELDAKLASSTQKEINDYRSYQIWAEAAFQNVNEDDTTGIGRDQFGDFRTAHGLSNYGQSVKQAMQSGKWINDAREAGIAQTRKNIDLLMKKADLYDDQHALNQIQIQINDFAKTLTNMGISPTSVQFLTLILSLFKQR